MATHICPGRGCQRDVPQHQLACPADWARVSKATQVEVYAAYRSGDHDRHFDAMAKAIAEMNEGRP